MLKYNVKPYNCNIEGEIFYIQKYVLCGFAHEKDIARKRKTIFLCKIVKAITNVLYKTIQYIYKWHNQSVKLQC